MALVPDDLVIPAAHCLAKPAEESRPAERRSPPRMLEVYDHLKHI